MRGVCLKRLTQGQEEEVLTEDSPAWDGKECRILTGGRPQQR